MMRRGLRMDGTHNIGLAFEDGIDLGCRSKLADIDLGKIAEGCECLARLSAPDSVERTWVAADAVKLRLHEEHDIARGRSFRGKAGSGVRREAAHHPWPQRPEAVPRLLQEELRL